MFDIGRSNKNESILVILKNYIIEEVVCIKFEGINLDKTSLENRIDFVNKNGVCRYLSWEFYPNIAHLIFKIRI